MHKPIRPIRLYRRILEMYMTNSFREIVSFHNFPPLINPSEKNSKFLSC